MNLIVSLIVVVALLLLGGIIYIYNRLVSRAQMVRNGWADIDVQLKRRADLIPSLVKIVQGYAGHERALFEEVAAKRGAALSAGDDLEQRGEAETALSQPVSRLMALAEDYPELKANQNFLDLQNELSDTEDKIEMARRFYNGAVRELNILVQSFPANLFAGAMGYRTATYFEVEPSARIVPSVNLGGPDA